LGWFATIHQGFGFLSHCDFNVAFK
jgi:hypothetical protein